MQIIKSFFIFFSFAIIMASCNNGASSTNVDPLLQQAFDYHVEAMNIEKILKEKLDAIHSKKNSIQIQGRALTEGEMNFLDEANRTTSIYEIWQNNRVEVPGFEHEHDHSSHEGHDHHHHGNDVKLTPQQMKEVQEESLRNIKDILKKAEGVL